MRRLCMHTCRSGPILAIMKRLCVSIPQAAIENYPRAKEPWRAREINTSSHTATQLYLWLWLKGSEARKVAGSLQA